MERPFKSTAATAVRETDLAIVQKRCGMRGERPANDRYLLSCDKDHRSTSAYRQTESGGSNRSSESRGTAWVNYRHGRGVLLRQGRGGSARAEQIRRAGFRYASEPRVDASGEMTRVSMLSRREGRVWDRRRFE